MLYVLMVLGVIIYAMTGYCLICYACNEGKDNKVMRAFASILSFLLPVFMLLNAIHAYERGKRDLAKEVLEGHPSVVAEYKVSTEIEYKKATAE